ncbi:SAVED domain-containing protein [Avibacterium avium]|uniref:SAVED domain-containing protein n=1 Tax=Avibacterium avium TaxID=751 RepID=UPI003BF8AD9A
MMFKKMFNLVIEYIFRRKSYASMLLTSGVSLILGSLQGLAFILKFLLNDIVPIINEIEIDYGETYIYSFLVGLILIVISIYWECRNNKIERNKPKFGLYQKYLTNSLERDFKETINKKAGSNVTVTEIDISQFVENSILIEPEKSLKKINNKISAYIENVYGANNYAELYYGGLMAVPFTFYTGMELDDRYPITVFDYDRNNEKWKEIKEIVNPDFAPNIYIENNGNNSGDSIISIGVSYPINEDEIQSNFPDYPISKIAIEPININNHWDITFQKELQSKFFELAQKLAASGTKTIHLILAAQNSVSFNLGRCYDNRNLPEIIVYQYEKGNEIKYPWGVKMKTSGLQGAEIITIPAH